MTDLDELRKAAEKATPGEWTHYRNKLRPQFGGMVNEVQCSERGVPIVKWVGFDDSSRSERKHAANARFIALANPQTILSLIGEIERLKAALTECAAPWSSPSTTVIGAASYLSAEFQRRMNLAGAVLSQEEADPGVGAGMDGAHVGFPRAALVEPVKEG